MRCRRAKLKMTFSPRTAGLGSLGRPRWVGLAQWQGAPVLREVKAALPSAWTRANGGSRGLYCFEIATGRYRAPDPWFALEDGIVVRRLSPNNRKLDAETHPLDLISRKYLRAMGASSPPSISAMAIRKPPSRTISRTATRMAGIRGRPRGDLHPARTAGVAARPANKCGGLRSPIILSASPKNADF